MKLRAVIAFVFFLSFYSCKQDASQSTTNEQFSALQMAMDKLKSEPGKEAAATFISEVRKSIAVEEDSTKILDLLLKGLSVSEEYKMGPTAIGFLMPLLKDFPQNPQYETQFAKLASALLDIGKTIPGDLLVHAYVEQFPNGAYKDNLLEKQKEKITDPNAYILTLAEAIFENPDQFGVNKVATQKYVDACEAFAIGYPNDDMAPVYLFRAAEMARTIKTYAKALSIFDWIEQEYPDFEKAPTALFLKGFMLENELNNKEAAKLEYNKFLTTYPESDLVDDVNFLLENIDKTDEEIMKMIDEKAKK